MFIFFLEKLPLLDTSLDDAVCDAATTTLKDRWHCEQLHDAVFEFCCYFGSVQGCLAHQAHRQLLLDAGEHFAWFGLSQTMQRLNRALAVEYKNYVTKQPIDFMPIIRILEAFVEQRFAENHGRIRPEDLY